MKSGRRNTPGTKPVVFLFDVDNTLLNNDRVTQDLQEHLEREVGRAGARRYWAIFEDLRAALGYADYLGALQRYRVEYPHDLRLLIVSQFLINYPFATRLYPDSLDVLEKAKAWGTTVLLTDGDVVFQPRKVDCSGLRQAVAGRVLCYVHKERELADVARRFPSRHYVVVDDKLRLLTVIKKIWGARVTTVFVRQGHYALDRKFTAGCPPADVTLERIGDFLGCDLPGLLAAARRKAGGNPALRIR
ncbi:MAG: HAD family hydrolase [Verrucomicrobiota bacterium]